MSKITKRILEQLGDAELLNKLLSLPNTDFNSLLLEIYKRRTDKILPPDILKAYQSNRFSIPSEVDACVYRSFEVELLTLAKKMDINNIILSPSAPLGSCSTFGYVDQYNVLSAMRGTETLSDPTNMLAIIIADKLKNNQVYNNIPLHYATTTRVIRGQVFPNIKGFHTHFGLFCMVSSGKDKGSYSCERKLLTKHLIYYRKLLLEKYNVKLSVTLCKRSGYTDIDGFMTRMEEVIKTELPNVSVSFDMKNKDNCYYKGISFKICMDKDGKKIEIGDGGFVDWISQMTGNKKERTLISGIGIDRLLIF